MNMRMNRFDRAAAAALAGALLSFAGPARGGDDARRPMDPAFDVLLKKSIFSRDRSRGSGIPSTAPATGSARVLSPEQSVAFRGVLCPDEEYVAFMENIQTGQITIVKAGDEIGKGRVAAITLDTLSYDADGKVHPIRLGQDLTGETAATGGGGMTLSTTSPSVAGTTAPGGTPPAAGVSSPTGGASSPAAAAMIEKMRQRRLQEGGR
jgi:hypothetical protein